MRHNSHHGGVYVRCGTKSAARYDEQSLGIGHRLNTDGEGAIIACTGRRNDPIGHFLLHHQHELARTYLALEKPENQWRGDVVGNVADDFRVGDVTEIHLHDILMNQREVFAPAVFALECSGELVIELDGGEMRNAANDVVRERARARPDLDDGIARFEMERFDDFTLVVRIDEKVLTERFLRANGFVHRSSADEDCSPVVRRNRQNTLVRFLENAVDDFLWRDRKSVV